MVNNNLTSAALREESTIAATSRGPFVKTSTRPLRVIVPACNEAARIESTLRDYCRHFKDSAEIVVVANGCTDNTVDVVKRLATRFRNLAIVDVPMRIGKGGAVRAGFLIGNEPYVGFVDADGSTSAAEFEKLFRRCCEHGVDGVIGSRWLPESRVFPAQPLVRRIASRAFNLIARLLFDLPYEDTQCGAKIFRRELLSAAMAHLELSNFAFDVDLLFNLRKAGAFIEECPVAWSDSLGSTLRIHSASMSMALALVRLRLLNSVLARIPFIDFIARDSVIPVAKPPSVLVLAGIPKRQLDQSLPSLEFLFNQIHEWQTHGMTVSWVQVDGPLRLLAVFLWYAIAGHSQYDVLFEVEGRFPRFLPYFSRKPRYLIATAAGKHRGTLAKWLARRIYGRMQRIGPETALEHTVANHPTATRYRTVFHELSDGWFLWSADVVSGSMRCVPLKSIDLRYEETPAPGSMLSPSNDSMELHHEIEKTRRLQIDKPQPQHM